MFNHYIPTADGTYQRQKIVPPADCQTPPQTAPAPQKPTSGAKVGKPDLGDLLVLLVLLLVMVENDDGDTLTPLITLASFLFLQ